jgi:hypothetical protein
MDLLPADDPWLTKLLALLPRADLYLQDEVQIALHPTLSRVWCRAGRRGQRLVQAPGKNQKSTGLWPSSGRRSPCVPNSAGHRQSLCS